VNHHLLRNERQMMVSKPKYIEKKGLLYFGLPGVHVS